MKSDHGVGRTAGRSRRMARILLVLAALPMLCVRSQWMTKDAAKRAIDEFEILEAIRPPRVGATDRRSSAPFITGDTFRDHCPHVCEDSNRCRMSPEKVKDGECVFVKGDLFETFVKDIMDRITSKFIAVIHNGDLSNPDGQTDARSIHMKSHVTSDKLEEAYRTGKLMALHTVNLWWGNYSKGAARPPYAHCLPIGCVQAIESNILYFVDYISSDIVFYVCHLALMS